MSGISTHVLDTATGRPVSGMAVQLWFSGRQLASATTSDDGRIRSLLPDGVPLNEGRYQIVFDTGKHFASCFYPEVRITFLVSDHTAHHHVPLLISPFGYTTYRGS